MKEGSGSKIIVRRPVEALLLSDESHKFSEKLKKRISKNDQENDQENDQDKEDEKAEKAEKEKVLQRERNYPILKS